MICKFKSFNQMALEIEKEAQKQKLETEWYKYKVQQLALRRIAKPI
ncbi:MAG: hypothetical protein PHT91_00330 [Candidatus Nanoarchaeia archaeon]|nr:hypothetical protein [Candidatus Nanoarchaeia archaeon]MDD5053944.1 hypothetical protein [Candidatus Nanoarchaeia archaeon]MDD5499307.1 hypothetical protein [Candidatus Nanoarchaeia archaeon]